MKQKSQSLFRDKRLNQRSLLSLFIPALPIVLILAIGPNGEIPKGIFAIPFFMLVITVYSILFMIVDMIIDKIFSSRYIKRCLSEKDISRLDDEGKAIVRDFLEKNGVPITESKFDSIVDSINLRKMRMQVKAERVKALSSQKKACEQ